MHTMKCNLQLNDYSDYKSWSLKWCGTNELKRTMQKIRNGLPQKPLWGLFRKFTSLIKSSSIREQGWRTVNIFFIWQTLHTISVMIICSTAINHLLNCWSLFNMCFLCPVVLTSCTSHYFHHDGRLKWENKLQIQDTWMKTRQCMSVCWWYHFKMFGLVETQYRH